MEALSRIFCTPTSHLTKGPIALTLLSPPISNQSTPLPVKKNSSNSLSVGIVSHGRWDLLQKCIQSLQQQKDSLPLQIILSIYVPPSDCPTSKDIPLSSIPQHILQLIKDLHIEVFYSEVNNVSLIRNQILQQATGDLIYFLDEDCRLPQPQYLDQLLQIESRYAEFALLAGTYQDSALCSFWGRAYNALCRAWLKKSSSAYSHSNLVFSHFLGGNFILRPSMINNIAFSKECRFGGEEIDFSLKLRQQGLKSIQLNHLSLEHMACHDIKNFYWRAWRHGQTKASRRSKSLESNRVQDLLSLFKQSPGLHYFIVACSYLAVMQLSFYIHAKK